MMLLRRAGLCGRLAASVDRTCKLPSQGAASTKEGRCRRAVLSLMLDELSRLLL